jgi:hypothetical protein
LRLLPTLLLAIFDRQTPNVQVITDADNHIDHEARIDADRETQAREHEGDLVDAVAEGAGPAESEFGSEEGAEGVEDAVDQRQDEDVLVGEGGLGEMLLRDEEVSFARARLFLVRDGTYGGDHLADTVRVDEADEEGEWHEVVVQNSGVESEVGDNDGPAGEEGNKAEKGGVGILAALSAGGHDVLCAVSA